MDTQQIETRMEQHHFDVTATPSQLQADDGLPQSVTLEVACLGNALDKEQVERFHSQSKKHRPLSYFANIYAHQDMYWALQTLTRQMEINMEGSEYVTEHTDNSLAWAVESHFMDMQICVGNGLGLAAMLPNVGMHHTLEFQLDLRYWSRWFQAKHANLGFDPTHRMLWVGRSSSGEDAWLAWVPRDDDTDNDADVGVGSGKEDTVLTEKHYRMTVMFLAEMLKCIGHQVIIVTDQYPSLADDQEYKYATNLMWVAMLQML